MSQECREMSREWRVAQDRYSSQSVIRVQSRRLTLRYQRSVATLQQGIPPRTGLTPQSGGILL